MSFRRRVVLLSAGAVAVAVVIASLLVYVLTSNELHGQVDASLRERLRPGSAESVRVQASFPAGSKLAKLAREGKLTSTSASASGGFASGDLGGVSRGSSSGGQTRSASPEQLRALARTPAGASAESRPLATRAHGTHPPKVAVEPALVARAGGPGLPPALLGLRPGEIDKLVLPQKGLGGAAGYVQLIRSNGTVLRSEAKGRNLPITPAVRAVAAGKRGAFFSDVSVDGTPMRVLVERAPPAGVWEVALPLTDTNSTLSHLLLVLAIVCLGGIVLAAALGLLVARAAVRPVRRLTGAAERVARTQDLGHRIRAGGGDDELGRLSASFNTMLAALERSRLSQRQLISDASHELRTPLTSIQANLDALALGERLPQRERERVLAAAQAQLRELAVLVGDLVDLSKSEFEDVELEYVRLDLAAGAAIDRARLHAPRCRFELDAQPCLVRAAPARLDRAIANLLDNAVKWGPPQGPVEVRVLGAAIEVRDHGPGIDPQDLPRVFDRFYRAASARARPGSGLGLAIVRQAAEAHGGSVHAANDPGGGARLTLELPPEELAEPEQDLGGAHATDSASGSLHEAPRRL